MGGVLGLDSKTGEWSHHSLGTGTTSNWSTAIATTTNNEVWVGTNGTGVLKLDGENTIRFNRKNSRLTNEHVTSLAIDEKRHFLWMLPEIVRRRSLGGNTGSRSIPG